MCTKKKRGKKKMGNKVGGKQQKKPKLKGEYDIFTLGLAGAGKSTFIKQGQILYNGGFSDEQKNSAKEIIYNNVVTGLTEVYKEMKKQEVDFSNVESAKKMRVISSLNHDDFSTSISKWKEHLLHLWFKEQSLVSTWRLLNIPNLILLDYHMNQLERYCKDDYIPSDEDILRARQRTTGQFKTEAIVKNYLWKISDLGGQKSEILKWEQIIAGQENDGNNDLKVILFFVSLVDFDNSSNLQFDTGTSLSLHSNRGGTESPSSVRAGRAASSSVVRKTESSTHFAVATKQSPRKSNLGLSEELFGKIIEMTSEMNFITVVCFNKIDLFEEKIGNPATYKKFKEEFSDYNGDQNVDNCTKYLENRFRRIASLKSKNDLSIYITCGLNTNLIKETFKKISDVLISNRLNSVLEL